jgi:hypothetical protein
MFCIRNQRKGSQICDITIKNEWYNPNPVWYNPKIYHTKISPVLLQCNEINVEIMTFIKDMVISDICQPEYLYFKYDQKYKVNIRYVHLHCISFNPVIVLKAK